MGYVRDKVAVISGHREDVQQLVILAVGIEKARR